MESDYKSLVLFISITFHWTYYHVIMTSTYKSLILFIAITFHQKFYHVIMASDSTSLALFIANTTKEICSFKRLLISSILDEPSAGVTGVCTDHMTPGKYIVIWKSNGSGPDRTFLKENAINYVTLEEQAITYVTFKIILIFFLHNARMNIQYLKY